MTKPSSSLVQAILGSGSIVGVMDAVAGIVYGVLAWLAMNFVVVPLSQVASGPIRLTTATAIMILIHMFVIGVPIAFLAERYYSK